MSLPNLSFLTLDIATPGANKRGAGESAGPSAKRTKREVGQVELDERFHLIFNNCAAYALKVFEGFALCGLGIWKYAPTRCKPQPDTDADLPDEKERARVVSIFLEGTPKEVANFGDLRALVEDETKELTAFVLSTAPNETKETRTDIRYHAMIGLLFKDSEKDEDGVNREFGVTFGAYPVRTVTEDSCSLQGGNCKNRMVVVLGDQIAVCARDEFPRRMSVRVRVPGDNIRKKLVAALEPLSGSQMEIDGVGTA